MTTTPTPTEVVAAVYEAFGRGDIDTLLTYVDPAVEWCQTEAGARHPVIERGRGIGHDAVRAYFAAVGEHMAVTKFLPKVIAASGETVLSLIELEFADPAVGKSVSLDEVHVFTVRNGKIVHYMPILDTAAVTAAFAA
jgi:ketosteroid isomerase-like protein